MVKKNEIIQIALIYSEELKVFCVHVDKLIILVKTKKNS